MTSPSDDASLPNSSPAAQPGNDVLPDAMALLDDTALPGDAPALKLQIADVEARQQACLAHIRALVASEDPAKGIFHAAAIHEAKQRKMMLQYQKDLRIARLNRLGMEE